MQLGNPLERIYGGGDVYEAAMLLVIGIQHITCTTHGRRSRWSLNNANQVYRKLSFGLRMLQRLSHQEIRGAPSPQENLYILWFQQIEFLIGANGWQANGCRGLCTAVHGAC